MHAQSKSCDSLRVILHSDFKLDEVVCKGYIFRLTSSNLRHSTSSYIHLNSRYLSTPDSFHASCMPPPGFLSLEAKRTYTASAPSFETETTGLVTFRSTTPYRFRMLRPRLAAGFSFYLVLPVKQQSPPQKSRPPLRKIFLPK